MRTSRLVVLFTGLIAALALVGCVGGDDESKETATGPPRHLGAISFVIDREVQDVRNVYTIDPDGGDLRLLVRNADGPVWSADGRVLAYFDNGCGVSAIDVARHRTRQVVSGDLSGYCPQTVGPSPDGERVAFAGDEGIWTMPVGGGTPMQVSFGHDDSPRWAPDGRHIAFVDGRSKVSIVESEGGSPRKMTVPHLYSFQELVWSPDSRRIAFGGVIDSNHVHVLDVGSGRITTVAPRLWTGATPAWSPDGTRLALRKGSETYVVQVSSGAVRRVKVVASDLDDSDDGNVSWSPDGTRLAVPANGDLWVVRVDGTGKKRVFAAGYGSSIEDVEWHPGGLSSAALGGKPASARAPVVHVNALGDPYSACGIELWRAEGSRWLVAGEGNTGRAYAKPLRPGVWQILDGDRDAIGEVFATNPALTRWKITDARGTPVGSARGRDGAWIALVLLWGGADCLR